MKMAEKEYLNREDAIDAVWYVSKTGIVKEFSPADVAPVVHGYWINNKCTDTIICSECKKYFQYKTFYCPNCGAKMDGKEEANKTLKELEEKG